VLLATVLERKQTARAFAVVDCGMSELLRPMLYGAVHPMENLSANQNSATRASTTLDIAGAACESGDILGRDVVLSDPHEGDVLAILVAGAYGSSMASNYLTRPRPAEVLLENEQWVVLRRRETVAEMLQFEV
jgi:diaminopimelate decarboxylase